MMNKWIDADKETPKNDDGLWSDPVIAISDTGDVFKLSCIGGYWQRTSSFINTGSTKIVAWCNMPTRKDFNDE